MLRLRLAILALACGFVFTLSGCRSTCDDDRLFPRLFRSNSMSQPRGHGECECQHGQMPHMMESAQGPILTTPGMAGTTMPTITTVPANQPPVFSKIPLAPATPYVPSVH